MRDEAVAVIDVGKTHVRLFAIEPDGRPVVEAYRTSNRGVKVPPYLHIDVERIWDWLLESLSDLGQKREILAIVPCTHGSSVGLVDDDGLVLPMMDYEAEPPADIVESYARIAPDFVEGYCPINPGSLTVGRQFHWQSRHHPNAFSRAKKILFAPQYWGWRLTGKLAFEPTSIGAQTQLWNPRGGRVTDLVKREGWDAKFPELKKPYDELGPLRPELAQRLGLDKKIKVLVGIHDSNANYARYLAAGFERFTLISSGTWLITFDTDLPLERLEASRDMVANIDLEGRPVACTRFMGGREFAEIAGQDGLKATPSLADLEKILAQGTMALPSFTDSGGPFPGTGNQGRIEGRAPATPEEKSALAALYLALVTDIDLDLLQSKKNVIIDGSFAENFLYTALLAALRPSQPVMASTARDGTALGAALLYGWKKRTEPVPLDLQKVEPFKLDNLESYRTAWRSRAGWG